MKSILFTTLLVFASLTHGDDPKSPDLTGYWEGAIQVNTIPLRFTFHFKKDTSGSWTATLESHDEGFKDLPVMEIKLDEKKLSFEIPTAKATFTGTINEANTRIDGKWKQASTLPLILKKVEKPLVLNRPQLPKKPYPYVEEELIIENQSAAVKLTGTLTKPKGEGPFPLVILISGSGPQDRDETLLGHKPFLVLADHLTRNGIAVFRFDDRGTHKSTGDFKTATTQDFASDVSAIFTEMKKRKEIDAKKIGLMGHSEGGVIAPMVAAESKDVAFIVLLAGTGVPGDELLVMQNKAILKAMGVPDALMDRSLKLNFTLFALVKEGADEEKLKAAGKEYLEGLTQVERALGGTAAEEQINAGIKQVSSPWMRFFIRHDPRTALKKVKCPVLAVNGELDLQVPPKQNLGAITEALKEAGNTDVTTKEFPKMNHLFQTCKTGLPNEYGTIEETFSPEVIEVIAKWITERVGK